MPIYMIMPRYSHNYAQFYQLLNSNLFTHRRILMLLREATSETYGPRVYSHHINLHHFYIVLLFTLLLLFTLHLYIKNTKNILSIRSHSRKWPWRAWQPLIALVAGSYRFAQVRGTWAWAPTGLIPWFSKTEGNTYATIAASPFPLQGKPTQAQDVAICFVILMDLMKVCWVLCDWSFQVLGEITMDEGIRIKKRLSLKTSIMQNLTKPSWDLLV